MPYDGYIKFIIRYYINKTHSRGGDFWIKVFQNLNKSPLRYFNPESQIIVTIFFPGPIILAL